MMKFRLYKVLQSLTGHPSCLNGQSVTLYQIDQETVCALSMGCPHSNHLHPSHGCVSHLALSKDNDSQTRQNMLSENSLRGWHINKLASHSRCDSSIRGGLIMRAEGGLAIAEEGKAYLCHSG